MSDRWLVVNSDALSWLRELPDAYADSAVLDPPSGIGFMGKDWDSDKGGRENWVGWLSEILAELRRVLKPGAHILVWAIPRTSHWTGTAIELAGFDVRDCVTHIFGSGFPKSHNISKGIDKLKDNGEDIQAWRDWLGQATRERGLSNQDIDAAFGFNGMACHWISHPTQPSVPKPEQMPKLLELLGLDGLPDAIAALFGKLNDDKGKPGDAWFRREVVGTKTGVNPAEGAFYSPGDGEYVQHEYDITEPATDLAKEWDGWGTALKPAAEFWWLARVPLIDTIARNVMAHGTGGLNIAGCRVDTAGENVGPGSWSDPSKRTGVVGKHIQANGDAAKNAKAQAESVERTNRLGRYPPNLLLTHDADCDDETCAPWCPVKVLDDQSGIQKDGVAVKRNLPPEGAKNGLGLQVPVAQQGPDETYGGGGGASRFFPRFRYQAKPSRSEREAGLEAFPIKAAKKFNEGGIQGRRDAKAAEAIADAEVHSQGLDARGRTLVREDGSKTLVDRFIPGHRANIHPTVKPIGLMRWLVRLVNPPGGLVLDPFTGSGTTGCAAMLEGARFGGSELGEEFARIARARIAHAAGEQVELTPLGTAAPPPRPTKPEDKRQMGLFA